METPPLPWGQKPAGFWIRGGALFLDFMACGIVALPLAITGAVLQEKKMEAAAAIVFLLYVLVYVGYFSLFTAWKGATLGKMALGLKVLAPNGEKPGFLRSLARFFASGISYILLGIGYLIAAFDAKKLSLHDRIVSTQVVRMRSMPIVGIIALAVLPLFMVASMGIVAAVAIPKFAEMLEKSKAGATKANLSSLRSAISIYYGDHGKFPASIDSPDFVGKYIDAIPPVKLKGTPLPGTNVETYRFTDGDGQVNVQRLKLSGGWAYDPRTGIVIVDSAEEGGRKGEPAYSW